MVIFEWGIRMEPDRRACIIRRTSISGAVAMIRRDRPVLARVREETGYSLQHWMQVAPTMKEASLMAGVSYPTVRRYRERWGK